MVPCDVTGKLTPCNTHVSVFSLPRVWLNKSSHHTANLGLTCVERAATLLMNLTFPASACLAPLGWWSQTARTCCFSACSLQQYCSDILLQQRLSDGAHISQAWALAKCFGKCSECQASCKGKMSTHVFPSLEDLVPTCVSVK